ncbi:MAG: glucosamine-6-phosphate deaminase [Phycisphaerales bacterium]|nr:glucosamine-6-phosphate deaminase [Phycisphaerales bacterium]
MHAWRSTVIRAEPVLDGPVFKAREKLATTVCLNDVEAAKRVARLIADEIVGNNAKNRPTVLGLATGNTPIGVYRELIRLHREEGLDFSRVITFNLDEYYPIRSDSMHSYHRWMWENFFDHVNIASDNVHIPDGTVPDNEVGIYCRAYEEDIKSAGGIDIQLLGIGRTGHIGFNEPGSSRDSMTRMITLDPVTRRDAAADFFGEDNVPRRAITMGVATILQARRVILMAFGEQKAPIIQRAVEGEVTDAVAASFLQEHPCAEVWVDCAAAEKLTRMACPWLLGDVEWTPRMQQKAVIWLSLKTGKSILKLDHDDYDLHHLSALVRQAGPVDMLNQRVFRRLLDTIIQHGSLPTGISVLCFSPHPDDDVISMGGTLTRLARRGNEVFVAYMTSGNIAVTDEHALQMIKFWTDLNHSFELDSEKSTTVLREVRRFLESKTPGEADSLQVQRVKSLIRQTEALAACRHMGIPEDHAHFLELPFYKTGQVRKLPITDADIDIVFNLIREIRPKWIFVAGELSDPHGTHRLCAEAIMAALKRCSLDEHPEIVWLYRGAWQEWEPDEIDMAIPLSKGELTNKIFGIFKHQSQKDKALFPGPFDDREFWQRAEARNTETAAVYNKLGLPEYHAMEAFVRYQQL